MAARTHGMSKTPMYYAWLNLKQRCDNPNHSKYAYYGGRGVGYDPRWKDFEAFLADMGPRPEHWEGPLSVEREDNNRGYCKENCRWATASEQAANKRTYSNNTSGCKGVYRKNPVTWVATVVRDGLRKTLYSGPDFSAAVAARKAWDESPTIF